MMFGSTFPPRWKLCTQVRVNSRALLICDMHGLLILLVTGETVVRKFTGNKCSPKLETFSASHTLLWHNNTAGDYEVYDADCNPKDLLPVVTGALSQGPGATDGTNLCNPVALCASVRLHSCMLICPWRCFLACVSPDAMGGARTT
jgi:hypothetical protein